MAYNCGFDFFEKYLQNYNSLDLLEGELDLYLNMISQFEYCIELDNFVLSHAGIAQNNRSPFTDTRAMFPTIHFNFKDKQWYKKTQIHGHLVRTIKEIQQSVKQNKRQFSIDSGCYLRQEGLGYLTALNLDTMELFHQKSE